jgi:hypothetical protein
VNGGEDTGGVVNDLTIVISLFHHWSGDFDSSICLNSGSFSVSVIGSTFERKAGFWDNSREFYQL